jgi:hypothetical protein
MKKYFIILSLIISNLIHFNTLANKPNKPSEPKSSYKILSREGVKKHFALNKTFLKEIYNLKPNKSSIELEIPYYLKNEKFNIIKNESLKDGQLSYKINNLNNKNIGELNISEDNCKLSFNYGDKKINLESDLNSNESYNKKVFKLIEKQKPTKYFKLNKDVLKELYDSEYEDFILEMPITENTYETFYLKKNKNIIKFSSPRKDENYNTKKHIGVSYSVNFFGEKLGNLYLYESSLDFNIDFLDKNITIENLETGKLKCVSVNKNNSNNDVKNIGQLVNKFDKINKERKNNKKLSEKNYYENFEEDNNLDIKIENQTEPIKKESIDNQNKIKPIKIENNKLESIENDDIQVEEQKPIVVNISSTDLDNLGIKIKEKILESSNANAPPSAPPTRVTYNPVIPCQKVLINVEVSYDHWTKMQPQNQTDLQALTRIKGRPNSNNPFIGRKDGLFFSEDMIGRIRYEYDAGNSNYFEFINRNPWDTSRVFTEQEALPYPNLNYIPGPLNESQKLIKTIFIRNKNFVENRIRSYLNRAIDVFDAEGIAVGLGRDGVVINYIDNLNIRTRVGDKYVKVVDFNTSVQCGGGIGGPGAGIGQTCRTFTDNRPQRIWFNQTMGMYQKQRYPEGSFWGDVSFPVIGPIAKVLTNIFTGDWQNLGWWDLLGFLAPLYGGYLVGDFLWYLWEDNFDPEPYRDCTHFIVPSSSMGGYFLSTKPDTKFKANILGVRVGQAWDNIFTPGMEDAVLDRFANVFGGKVCFPRKVRDTLVSQVPGTQDTIIVSIPSSRPGLHFYVGENIPYYDNEDPNSPDATEQYKHEMYIRAFTSTETQGDYLDQSYNALNDRQESHPFLNDEMPTFNHENYLPMYSNMKNNFYDAIPRTNNTLDQLQTGMHLKDIGIVMPFLSTPWASYTENSGMNLSLRGANDICNEYSGYFNWSIGILPLLFDDSYYTTDYNRFTQTATGTYTPIIGTKWNLVDHQELYGEWYEYGNTDYPPYNIQKWNEWMFVYGIAQSLGARYFTTEANPNTILAPLARNLNYNEANYRLEDGTPRISHSYAFSQYSDMPNSWAEWYGKQLAQDGFFILSDITNPGDFDMDGIPTNSAYDYVAQGLQLGAAAAGAKIEFETKTFYATNPSQPRKFWTASLDARGWGDCVYPHHLLTASLKGFDPRGLLLGYAAGLVLRNAYSLYEKGWKNRFSIGNVCDATIFTKYPNTYSTVGTTFCGGTKDQDFCGTTRPFGSKDFDVRYNYYNLGTRDGFEKKYTGFKQNQIRNYPLCSVDMISWAKGFDKLTGDLIRLNMTNYAVSGQNPYFDTPTGVQLHLSNQFRLEPAGNASRFPFYGNQVPYAKMFIPTIEYVEGDTIRAFTNRLNVRQAFRADFNRLVNSKTYATNIYQNEIPNRITYTDANMQFRWFFVDTNAINIRGANASLNQLTEAQPRVVSTDSTLKIVVPSYRRLITNQQPDSLYGIFPLTLYTINTPGCESNPATKFIKVHPRKLLPVTEKFTRWTGTGAKKALKGWDFKNVWSAGDGMADRPDFYPSQAGQLGFYLRGSFVNDPRMNAGTGWGISDNYPSVNNRNWKALTYTPLTMEKTDIYTDYYYFKQDENVRGNKNNNIGRPLVYDGLNNRLASPFKSWYSKKGAFNEITRPVLSNSLGHHAYNPSGSYSGSPLTSRNWEGRWNQIHGTYSYWRSGTVDTSRSPIYTNSDVDNNILYMKFDISNFFAANAVISVAVNRCLGEGNCASEVGSQVTNGRRTVAITAVNEGGANAMAIRKDVTVGEHSDGLGFKQTYTRIFPAIPDDQGNFRSFEYNQFLNNQLVSFPGTYQYQVPSNTLYDCRQSDARPISGCKPKCIVIPEEVTDTLFIYGRFGISSPLVLLRKIGGRDLNTTSEFYQPQTFFENYDVYDNNTMFALRETNTKPSIQGAARLSYKYLKVHHTPKPQFDKNEWKTIMLDLKQYDTCRTMQFNFVYKNGKANRFNQYGDYRHFSAHSPLYITNMEVKGSLYLPLCGTDTLPKVSVDSSIQGCDKKAVYKLKVAAGHNAKKYLLYFRESSSRTILKVKEGSINNVFSLNDSTYSPNAAFEIIDSIENLKRNTLYEIYALLINNDSYVALDTFKTNSVTTIVDCPMLRMAKDRVLTSDSGFSFKNRDNTYSIRAKFPNSVYDPMTQIWQSGHQIKTYQLFERKESSPTWTAISPIYTTPQFYEPNFNNGIWDYTFNPINNKPNGKYYYRLELKNPDTENIYPNTVYSNIINITQCFGCKDFKAASLVEEPELSEPDPLTGNFSLKVSLERYHGAKRIELYERRMNNSNDGNSNSSTELGNKIWSSNLPNDLEFTYIHTFPTHLPGLYYYSVKVYDVNNESLLTGGLKVIYPERTLNYCGPYLTDVYQTSNSTVSTTNQQQLSNRLQFYFNPSCNGNKYKIYAYKLKDYQNLLSNNPELTQYQLDLLPREQTATELFGTGPNIILTEQETIASYIITGQLTNGYFNREISPKLTSLNKWYVFDIICVSCLNGDNKRTVYKYLKKPIIEREN